MADQIERVDAIRQTATPAQQEIYTKLRGVAGFVAKAVVAVAKVAPAPNTQAPDPLRIYATNVSILTTDGIADVMQQKRTAAQWAEEMARQLTGVVSFASSNGLNPGVEYANHVNTASNLLNELRSKPLSQVKIPSNYGGVAMMLGTAAILAFGWWTFKSISKGERSQSRSRLGARRGVAYEDDDSDEDDTDLDPPKPRRRARKHLEEEEFDVEDDDAVEEDDDLVEPHESGGIRLVKG